MRKQQKTSEQLEAWEQEAYAGGWGADWLEEVGENVKFYVLACEASGKTPTFSGLMQHLAKLAKAANTLPNE